jgi:hypothetical protein
VISNSGPGTESNQRPTPAPRRPKAYWMVHVALVLLAVVVAAIFMDRGNGSLLRAASTWIPALLVVLFAAQTVIARRAPGALGNGVGYALCAAGALCMVVANLVVANSLVLALSISSALLFLSGTIVLIVQLGKIARSRDVQP